MKRIFILSLFAISSLYTGAQDIDAIAEMYNKKQYKEAKTAVDKMLADAKNANNSDAWYFKGRIYNALSQDAAVPKSEAISLKTAAFEAFQNAQKFDPKDMRMKLETYTSYLDLYLGLYDLGANLFNDKDFASAYTSFTKAMDVENFILAKKYEYPQVKLYQLDTALVLNTAIAASQAKREEDAMRYYRKLADANVSGKSYLDVYQLLADYYNRRKETDNLNVILDKGRKLYPEDGFWNELELKNITDKPALFARYEELIAKSPSDFTLNYNYAIELYNYIYTSEKRPDNQEQLKEKLTSVLKAAIAADKEIDAAILMCNHSFNVAADISSASNLAKDPKKKAELKKASNAKMDECITYCNTVAAFYDAKPSLKQTEKALYRNVLGYVQDIYGFKNDQKKVAEITKKRATLQ
ncbi:MAG: hypothetical protein WAT19_15265 [Ferruginibacter sp.]